MIVDHDRLTYTKRLYQPSLTLLTNYHLFLSELLLRFSSLPFCFSDLCLSDASSPRLFLTDPSAAEDSSRS